MAQAKRKRRRRHRGTQAGTIETPGRTGRARTGTRAEGRQIARQRRQDRFDRPPTWRGALNRSLFAAAIVAVLMTVTQKNVAAGLVFGAFAVLLYLPISYLTDRALYNRRQRQKQRTGGGGSAR